MTTYIVRRLLQALMISFGLAVFFFFLLHLSPTGPCDYLKSSGALNAQRQYDACLLRYGLDKSLPLQFVYWANNVIHGNFGVTQDDVPVGSAILTALPPTVLLIGISYLIQELIALPLGISGCIEALHAG